MNNFLAPGSNEAIKAGCKCPVIDNNHGAGLYKNENGERQYVYNMECPIHNSVFKLHTHTLGKSNDR